MASAGAKEVAAYLATKQNEEKNKDVAADWTEIEELYNRKYVDV